MNNLNQLQFVFSKNLAKLIQFANSQGLEVTIGEVFRTQYQQAHYYAIGYSKTKDSYHMKKLAVDMYFFKKGELIMDDDIIFPIALHWESLHQNNVAGFYWGWDKNHFEMRENNKGNHQKK